jgi:predicted 3-demethylubiquinone-9 3-methyltransferase (glyoxalase superfamily)
MKSTRTITPCLWFDGNAEEAVEHYLKVFGNGHVVEFSRYGDATPELAGRALMIVFELEGQRIQALNGGAPFPFNESLSLSVSVDTQADVDRLWAGLCDGGSESQCGWLKDKFGLSWQIVPRLLPELLQGSDPERAARVMQAMFGMRKLDIASLQRAYDGE